MNSYDAYLLTLNTGVSNLKLEEVISKDGSCSFHYAKYILKGRFRLGEETMVQSSNFYCSVDYVMNVMGYNHD